MRSLEAIAADACRRAVGRVDIDRLKFAAEMVEVGEPELALVTLIELGPVAVDVDLVDEVEASWRGAYGSNAAQSVIARYRESAA